MVTYRCRGYLLRINYIYCTDTILAKRKQIHWTSPTRVYREWLLTGMYFPQSPRRPDVPAPERRQPSAEREQERRDGRREKPDCSRLLEKR